MLLVLMVFFGFIAGIAIWVQEAGQSAAVAASADGKTAAKAAGADWITHGSTHTGLGLALFIISVLALVAAVSYGVTSSYNKQLKNWKETEKAYVITTIVYTTLLAVFIVMVSVTLALH